MNPKKPNLKINKVINRILPITPSVFKGLEPEPKITDFTIIKELGEGSFSKVYLAQHNITQAQYAIKAIDKRNQENMNEKEYLRREAEIMYRINHPNIIKLYGHFEDNTYCYFIIEYMPGGNIYSLVPKYGHKKISTQTVASILKDIISATYYLHHMTPPIIHRDIKPENILINSQMQAKLIDFGWSNYLNRKNMKRTTICGTPVYLAPELVNNIGHDHRVDIWCIGVLMFELLTGQPPWMGDDVQTLKYNISMMNIKWKKNMDPDAVDLIKKTLRYNPEERISLRNMLMHPFFTKFFPDAVNSLIKPDGSKPNIFVVSRDNPQTYYSSSIYTSNLYDTNNIIYDNNNNISYSNNIVYDTSNIINNNNYTSQINEITYSSPPSVNITTSYPIPSLQPSSYITSDNNYNSINTITTSYPISSSNNYTSINTMKTPLFSNSLNFSKYSTKTYNSLNLKELIENQERIDELVKKSDNYESINNSAFKNVYPSYNYDFNLKPIINHSSSIYKTQSPYYYSMEANNIKKPNVSVVYKKGIKYSVPPKYDVRPIKYSRPKIIYSSMTTKRNFEGDNFISGARKLNNLYSKYGII